MALVSHVGTTLQARVVVDDGQSLYGVVKFQGAANTAIETMGIVLLLAGHGTCRALPMVGNPCSAGTVLQALPTMQGMGSANSADLHHSMTVGTEQLRLAGLSAVNRGVGVGVVGDMGRGAVGGVG